MVCLVLDKAYIPTTLYSIRKAFLLDLQGRVDVLDWYPTEVCSLRTIDTTYQVPAVIRVNILAKDIYSPFPSRMAIFIRDNFTCAYCGKVCKDSELTIDHIIPKSRGGGRDWSNLITACSRCNQKKNNRTPEEANMKLLFKPYQPLPIELALIKYKKKLDSWFTENILSVYVPRWKQYITNKVNSQ